MANPRFIIALLTLCLLGLNAPLLLAEEVKNFETEIIVEIHEKDEVYARNQAFADARRELIQLASKHLIGEALYLENESYLRSGLKGQGAISRVKVIKEESKGKSFALTLQGTIRLQALATELRHMSFPIEGDPVLSVAIAIDQRIELPTKSLSTRLQLLKLKVKKVGPTAKLDPKQPKEVAQLFQSFHNIPVILLFEPIEGEEEDQAKGLSVKVIRHNDYQIVQNLTMSFSERDHAKVLRYLKSNLTKFLALFSVQTMQHSTLEGEEKGVLIADLQGLGAPNARFTFEQRVLKPNRLVERFKLIGIDGESSQYKIFSNKNQDQLIASLFQSKGNFVFTPLKKEVGMVQFQTTFQPTPRFRTLRPLKRTPTLEKKIKQSVGLNLDHLLPKAWTPTAKEREPNNSSLELNQIEQHQLILGRLNSRADDDLYQIQSGDKKNLLIDWIKIGKSYLRPELRLYDADFNLLKKWNMLPGQPKRELTYQFKEAPTEVLHLRIFDRIGYLKGETGGFRHFEYMIRYQTKD